MNEKTVPFLFLNHKKLINHHQSSIIKDNTSLT
jgi:hypothetical protein